MEQAEPVLNVRDLTIAFGGVRAVDGLSFGVPFGVVLSLIGPNGAGKTTVLNCISGFVPARGSISYRSQELVGRPAFRRASLGIGRTFQSVQLFGDMTLLDNVVAGQHAVMGGNVLLDIARFPVMARERDARLRAHEILKRLGIQDYADRKAAGLPFGIQKLAGVARALAVQPTLLLLDEPAAGLNRLEAEAFGRLIVSLRDDLRITVLLVEHNMRLVMGISDRIVVLDGGRKLVEGEPAAVASDPRVIEAYLGAAADESSTEEGR